MKVILKSIFVILFFLSVAFITSGCGETDGMEKGTEKHVKSVNVEVHELQGNQFTDFISVIGTIKPINSANLSYLPGGIIKEFKIDKGGFAKEGDTILVIDNDVLKANLLAAKAQYDLSQITFEKQDQIYKENVGSEYQYLQAKFNRDAAKASYDLIAAQLSDTYITAPFDGVVDAKYYEEGELAAPGLPIVYLLNRNKIKVEAGVPERYVGQIKIGQKAKINFENKTEPTFGKISYVGASVTTNNRTFPIEILIDYEPNIKAEMIAEVQIENGTYDNLITIPDEVITRSDDAYTVFVAEGGKAVSRDINILKRYQNKVAVSSGLSAGDKLIVVGYQNLVDGENVNIVN